MRYSYLAVALAAALGTTAAFDAAAAENAELAALKAQLAELQAKVAELETRTDAQSDINVGTQQSIENIAATTPKVETKGGIKVTSADKKFEASIGGRIHFDAYAFDRDIAATTGTSEFRRARLTLAGKALGWDYKLEQDFSAGTNLDGLRDAYIATGLWGGKATIGHFKPYRSMEELTSSNEILMMERPFASATGLFSGRQFQQGVGYQRSGDNYTAGFTVFNLRGASGTRNEGMGASGRVTWAPINNDNETLHFGGWASQENANQGSADMSAVASYAGRRGPSQTIATTTGASRNTITAYGLEAAGAFGPLFFQGEYANATFGQPIGGDQDVSTWYLQGSWLLNGGHKPYKAATGVFGSPKVDKGLWELTARYDTIENKDIADREATSVILGVNYYVNANLRFMFNYTQGENEVTGDETGQYALRTQFAW
ncbi:OprO/OprP family phosphate-selective porin [Pseudoxanthomonas kaohsiungensis]|uniref:OprO/OprP family phosphate-selective porin n=1 Tax=Pseudoxanthomonas kaohsiungensis TaxID=283923 RepID=A0ABW3LS07_9GAMM|nr:porin [Pseudoxanthomonas kaohsiungensis]KAF1700741.1 porin [Pseudoxanthomonas kaohsiungensis]